ncbi:MAG: hypothetical protein KKB13_10500 [Chloroflexi bacterium]|nr:hypothetical protein [Chloroflexota bacterium]
MERGQSFQEGNQAARQPRLSAAELAALRQQIRNLLAQLDWDERDLDTALGYEASQGYYTRQVLRSRHPSRHYRERLAVLLEQVAAGVVPAKPAWAPALTYDPGRAAVPLQRVVVSARQCVECVAEHVEGRREEADTWWWFGHPRTRVCPAHREAHRRRQAWFRRCRALGCPHPVVVDGLRPPAHTCTQQTCPLRRQPWQAKLAVD